MRYTALLSLIAIPVFAAPAFAACSEGTNYDVEIVEIVENMRAAPNEAAAREFSAAMWDIWFDAPDEIAQSMLDEGLALFRIGNLAASRRVYSRLIDYCPDYAEGYNQRAFASFMMGDLEEALIDLDAALDLQPVHLGALTGKAMTLIRLDRNDEAQDVLRTAVAINPWLAERELLDGTDI